MTQPTADTQALAQLDPGTLLMEVEALRQRPLTIMVVHEAKDIDGRLKSYLDQAEKSEVRSKINELFRQHKFWLSKFNAAVDPVLNARKFLSSLFARWETQRRMEADAERRKREEEARKQQEDQRIAEAAHLESQGHVEEAKAHLEAPMTPIALPDEKEAAGKIPDVTVLDTFKLPTDEKGKVKDNWCNNAALLAAYFVEHPEDLIALMEPKPNEWKRRATSAKGQWVVPGVTFIKQTETRNRG